MFRYVNNFFNNFDNFFLYNYIIKKRFYAVFGRFLRYVTRVNNNYEILELVNRLRTLKNQWLAVSFRVYSFIFDVVDMLIIDI